MKTNLRYSGIFIIVIAMHLSVFAIQFKQDIEPIESSPDSAEVDLTIIQLAKSPPEPIIVDAPSTLMEKETESEVYEASEPPKIQAAVSLQQRYTEEIVELKQKASEFIAKLNEKKLEIEKAEKQRREVIAKQQQLLEKKRQQEREAQQKIEKKKQQALAKKRAKQKKNEDEKARKRRIAHAKAKSKARAEARQRALAKKIIRKPSPLKKTMPSYPSSLRRKGVEGTVKMTLIINFNGKVSSVRIRKSSGHASFDKAALRAVKRWRYAPARNGLNQQVSCSKFETIVFQLN